MLELKDKKFLYKMKNYTINIRLFFYKIATLLSMSDENNGLYSDYSPNNNQKKENAFFNDNNINRTFDIYKKELYKSLELLHKDLLNFGTIDYRHNYNASFEKKLSNYYNEYLKFSKLKTHYSSVIHLNDFFALVLKDSITFNLDFIARVFIQLERKKYYLKDPPTKEEKRPIKKCIDNYLYKYKNNIKDKNFGISDEIQIDNNIKFKIFLNSKKVHVMNIKLNQFYISLQFPFNIKDCLKSFKFILNVTKSDEKLIEVEEKQYGWSCIKEEQLIMYKKLCKLFQHRFESIGNIIISEKRKYNPNIKGDDNDFLIQLVERFIEYIQDYNIDNIFKIKCSLCNKCAKYSFIEKCFLPPFYKLYPDYIELKNKDKKPNYFFHEECFKSLALHNV